MKNDKKVFIFLEAAMAVILLTVALVMILEKADQKADKVSVIVQDSDNGQWAAFRYGLRMAAEDQGVEVFVVSTGNGMTVEEEKKLIENEIANGADAVIVQPVEGKDAGKMLAKMNKEVPVMLVELALSEDESSPELPVTEPDQYKMGKALAEEVLRDYEGDLNGKTLAILSSAGESEAATYREKGFTDRLEGSGGKIIWSAVWDGSESETFLLEEQEADLLIALDDRSLIHAGETSAANRLHGALVYGIGHSMEAFYYLDTRLVECLIVPDEFSVGYQSLIEMTEKLRHYFYRAESKTVSYTVIRRDTLYSKENQEIMFTMGQ